MAGVNSEREGYGGLAPPPAAARFDSDWADALSLVSDRRGDLHHNPTAVASAGENEGDANVLPTHVRLAANLRAGRATKGTRQHRRGSVQINGSSQEAAYAGRRDGRRWWTGSP